MHMGSARLLHQFGSRNTPSTKHHEHHDFDLQHRHSERSFTLLHAFANNIISEHQMARRAGEDDGLLGFMREKWKDGYKKEKRRYVVDFGPYGKEYGMCASRL
jgi:hypothetical protein